MRTKIDSFSSPKTDEILKEYGQNERRCIAQLSEQVMALTARMQEIERQQQAYVS